MAAPSTFLLFPFHIGVVLRRDALSTPDMQGATDLTLPFYNDLIDGGSLLPLGWKGYEKSADACFLYSAAYFVE